MTVPQAVVVMTAKKAAALGLKPLARIAAFGTSGLDPATMGMGPVPASRKALQRAGWNAADVDLFELNEAFAAQACAVNKELGIDPAKVNVNGGAIAIGHPIGASGCRILVTLLHEMQAPRCQKGIGCAVHRRRYGRVISARALIHLPHHYFSIFKLTTKTGDTS
jgi:acetyl-CoA C-acetyltransferase